MSIAAGFVPPTDRKVWNDQRFDNLEILRSLIGPPNPFELGQEDVIDGILDINDPGSYVLVEKIIGTIRIQSDDVCLNLRCNCVDADGADHCILVDGYNGIKIFNGPLVGSAVSALKLANGTNLKAYCLCVRNNTGKGIHLDTVHNTDITHCKLYDNDTDGLCLDEDCTAVCIQGNDARGNDKGFVVVDESTLLACVLSNNKTLLNLTRGFEVNSTAVNTAMKITLYSNYADNDENQITDEKNYKLPTNIQIPLQKVERLFGQSFNVYQNYAIGAAFINIAIVTTP